MNSVDLVERRARQAAQKMWQDYACLFQSLPIRSSQLARALGIEVRQRKELRELALLERTPGAGARILVDSNLPHEVGRFALAHELGHFLLEVKRPLGSDVDTKMMEGFANCFAREVLVPEVFRPDLKNCLKGATTPRNLLALASRVGLSPAAFLVFVSAQPDWLEGVSTIWLRVKDSEHLFRGGAPGLRIISAHFDRSNLFIPINRRLESVLKPCSWAEKVRPGEEFTEVARLEVFEVCSKQKPKYVESEVDAEVSCMRLWPSKEERKRYFLLGAKVMTQ